MQEPAYEGEIGRVVEVDGDRLKVALTQSDRCKGCRACDFIAHSQSMILVCINDCQAAKGDVVEIGAKENHQVSAAAWLYLLPMAVFMAGLFFFNGHMPDYASVLMAFLCMAACYGVLYGFNRRRDTSRYLPHARRIVSSTLQK